MRSFKVLGYVAMCLGLAYCAGDVNETQDLLTTGNGTDVKKTAIYVGQYSQVEYFHGGGYPLPNVPNYSMILKLKVNTAGSIDGVVDTPECLAGGQVDPLQYSKLVVLAESAKFQEIPVELSIVDVPEKSLKLINDKIKDGTKKMHLQHYQPLLEVESATAIDAQVKVIADALLAKGCTDVPVIEDELKTLEYQVKAVQKLKNGQLESLRRAFRITKVGGKLTIEGSQIRKNDINGKTCTKKLSVNALDSSFIPLMEQIEFATIKEVCSVMLPIDGTSSKIEFLRTDVSGKKHYGEVGCWNQKQALKTKEFTDKFQALIAKVPAACSIRIVQPIPVHNTK